MKRKPIPKKKQSRKSAVGVGFVALDVIFDEWRRGYIALGGSTGNVLAILSYLGWSGTPIAKVGNDRAGTLIRKEFEALGANTDRLTPGGRTPVVYQSTRDGAHDFSFSCPYCGNKRTYRDENSDNLADASAGNTPADVFYFDRPTSSAIALAKAFRQRGALVCFEPSAVNTEDHFAQAIRLAHVVKYANNRIEDLKRFDLSTVVVEICTLGEAGLRFRAPSLVNDWMHLPAVHVSHVQDTAGAGDWSTAGMMHHLFHYGLIRSADDLTYSRVHKALQFGQALAALNCMYSGARGLSRRWAALYTMRTARSLLRAQRFAAMDPVRALKPGPALYAHVLKCAQAKNSNAWSNLEDLCCKALAI